MGDIFTFVTFLLIIVIGFISFWLYLRGKTKQVYHHAKLEFKAEIAVLNERLMLKDTRIKEIQELIIELNSEIDQLRAENSDLKSGKKPRWKPGCTMNGRLPRKNWR